MSGIATLSPDALAALLQAITGFWLQYGAVFLRIGTAILVLPGLGEAAIPVRVRLAAALALSLVVAPAVAGLPPGISPWRLAAEPVVGLSLGLVLRLFVLALTTAGAIIAQSISLAQMFGGGAGEPQPAVGHLLTIGGLAIAFGAGLHLQLVEALILSYDALPQGVLPAVGDIRSWGVAEVAHSFRLGLTLAAPFVIGSLLYNVALGVINRAMPQLMVSFIGAPALTLGGLALLALTVPVTLMLWQARFAALLANPFGGSP